MKNIETKFNTEDSVWTIDEMKAVCYPVRRIEIEITKESICIKYFLNKGTEKAN